MAKSIYFEGRNGLWEEIRPPLLPLLFSPLLIFSSNSFFLFDYLMLLFALGVLILTYLITKYFLCQYQLNQSKQSIQSIQYIESIELIPALSVILVAISPLFLIESSKFMTEVPSSFFILLTFYLIIKQKHPLFIGITAALAFLTKFPNFLLILAISIYYLSEWYKMNNTKLILKKLFYIYTGFLLIFIPFTIINYFLYRSYTITAFEAIFRPIIIGSLHQSNILHKLTSFSSNLLYYPLQFFKQNIFLIFSLFIIFFIKRIKEIKLLLITFIIYLIYFSTITNKQPRFSLIILPLLAIITSITINEITLYIKNKTTNKYYFIIFSIFIFFIFIFSTISITKEINLEIKQYYPKTKPDIIKDYYLFFNDYKENNFSITNSKTIITNPIFSAYSDLKFIPAYNNVTDLYEIFNENKAIASAIAYDTAFYQCSNQECEEQKQSFLEMLVNNYQLLYSRKDGDSQKYIFSLLK